MRFHRLSAEVAGNLPAGFSVPLKVEVKAGKTWADCQETKQPRILA